MAKCEPIQLMPLKHALTSAVDWAEGLQDERVAFGVYTIADALVKQALLVSARCRTRKSWRTGSSLH